MLVRSVRREKLFDSGLENWVVTAISIWLSCSSYLETSFSRWKWNWWLNILITDWNFLVSINNDAMGVKLDAYTKIRLQQLLNRESFSLRFRGAHFF